MKILIVAGGVTLPEVSEADLAEIYEASGEADIVVVDNNDDAQPHWPDAEVALGYIDYPSFMKAKQLRWFQSAGAGVDRFLFPEFVEGPVLLTSEKGLVGEHLADHAFALLLMLTRQMKRALHEAPRSWPSQPAMRRVMVELTGKTMGIIGLGGTGRAVAKRAKAFGMEVVAVEPESMAQPPEVSTVWAPARLNNLLRVSDVVAVCCPLTRETKDMLDTGAFAQMKPGAYLINVTRGEVVDGDALVAALREGKIAGAGLDVTPSEPLPEDHPLWQMENVIITPHTAGASQFRARRNLDRFIANLRRYRAGLPLDGLIDKRKGY